jgi:hypothetical protein
VVPFRERQPDYQRRWRLLRCLREIREKMGPLAGPLRARLRGLLGRTEKLSESPTTVAQPCAVTAQWLAETSTAVRAAIAAIEQLEASVVALSR